MQEDFLSTGVFYFSNASDEDFTALWNNIEYIFPKKSRVPLVIQGEPPENVQEIRKRFAKKFAVREFQKTDEFKRLSAMGNGMPPTYNENVLELFIQSCLEPLPIEKLSTQKLEKDSESKYKASKAVRDKDNLNEIFKDDTVGLED